MIKNEDYRKWNSLWKTKIMAILSKAFINMFISVLWMFVTYISLISEYCFLDTVSSADSFVFFLHTCLNLVLKFGSDGSSTFF